MRTRSEDNQRQRTADRERSWRVKGDKTTFYGRNQGVNCFSINGFTNAVLCCITLRCTTLHCTTPCHTRHTIPYNTTHHYHTIPYHRIPHYQVYHALSYHTIAYHTIPYHTIPHHTTPYHTIPYRTIPYTMPYNTVPNHNIHYHTIPYQTIPHHTTPYRTIPYHTIQHHTALDYVGGAFGYAFRPDNMFARVAADRFHRWLACKLPRIEAEGAPCCHGCAAGRAERRLHGGTENQSVE